MTHFAQIARDGRLNALQKRSRTSVESRPSNVIEHAVFATSRGK